MSCKPNFPHRPAMLATLLALAVSGCSVATPPAVATLSRPAERPRAVRIANGPGDTAAQARFAGDLARALAARGVDVSPQAEFPFSVAMADRPAATGVTARMIAAGAPADWLSAPRKHRLFDACHARRMAVSVEGGPSPATAAFNARGGFEYCTLDPAHLTRLADAFAAALAGP